jgi:hypothetical protein
VGDSSLAIVNDNQSRCEMFHSLQLNDNQSRCEMFHSLQLHDNQSRCEIVCDLGDSHAVFFKETKAVSCGGFKSDHYIAYAV